MTDKESKWIKFYPSLELPKERVSIAYATHDERGYRFAYGYFQFYNGTCGCFWKDGNEQPKVVKAEDIKYWMSVPSFDVQEEPVSEDLGEYINELSKQFPEVSFAKLSRIAVRVSRWQRNQDTKNKLPEVINRTDLDEYAYQCAYDMSNDWAIENPTWHDVEDACKLGANWQKEQDQETIELAEDHAYFAGRTKTIDEIKEALLSKVLPCFMHGGEADEVVAKLDEVLNQKK